MARVLLTGATGFTGAVVLKHLLDRGHEVIAMVRPHHIENLEPRGGVAWLGADFADLEAAGLAAREADAVIHVGASHNAEQERLDRGFIDAVAAALDQSGKAFITTSAVPVYGDTGAAPRDEREPIPNPLPIRAWRLGHDRRVIELSERGVRGVVIRPGHIFGHGAGIMANNVARALATGKATYVGDGHRMSTTVHVETLAELYCLALETPEAAGAYNAGSDETVRSREIAEAIARVYGPGIAVEAISVEQARATMGDLADIVLANAVISSTRARSELGWLPNGRTLMGELLAGAYAPFGARA